MIEDDFQKNDERLNKIRKSLDSLQNENLKNNTKTQEHSKNSESASVGLRAGAELVASIAAGAFFGFWLDEWLETKPLFLIIMVLLGVLTGFVNVWRTINGIGYQVGYRGTERPKHNSKDNNN